MRNTFRYGAALGILAAAFGTLGPVAAQASETPGTCAGACGINASVAHLATAFDTSLVLRNGHCETKLWKGIGRGLDRRCDFRSFGDSKHFLHSRDCDRFGHSEFTHSSHYSQVSYHARVIGY